jgi:hypothetical protein
MRDARVTHQHDFRLPRSTSSPMIDFEADHECRQPIDKRECRGGLRGDEVNKSIPDATRMWRVGRYRRSPS